MPHTHLVGSERRNRGRFERPVPFQPPTVRRDEELFLIFLRLRLPMLMLMMVGGLLLLRLGGGLLVTVPLLSHKLLLSLTRKPDLYGGTTTGGGKVGVKAVANSPIRELKTVGTTEVERERGRGKGAALVLQHAIRAPMRNDIYVYITDDSIWARVGYEPRYTTNARERFPCFSREHRC